MGFNPAAFDQDAFDPAGFQMEAGGGSDDVPEAFSFTDQTGAARSTLYTSNAITVLGIDTASAISITGGEYSVNGGPWTSTGGTVVLGDSVRVRGTSSASYSTAVNVALTIGGVSDTFTITTAANAAPSFVGPAIANLTLYQDVPASLSLAGRFTDQDAMTFSLIGTPPAGISLSSAGVLSGTPTTLETAAGLLVRASDGSLTADSNTFSIAIEVAPEATQTFFQSRGRATSIFRRRRGYKDRVAGVIAAGRTRDAVDLAAFSALINEPEDLGAVAASGTSAPLPLPGRARLALAHSSALTLAQVNVAVGARSSFTHPALAGGVVHRGCYGERGMQVTIARGAAPAGTLSLYVVDLRGVHHLIATATFT